jgi:hypothetical protein
LGHTMLIQGGTQERWERWFAKAHGRWEGWFAKVLLQITPTPTSAERPLDQHRVA